MPPTDYTDILTRARRAARPLALLTDRQRSEALLAVAGAIEASAGALLAANRQDMEAMGSASPLRDRLLLTPERLAGIAADMRHVASLPSPLGRESKERTLANGLRLRRVSVPFGVIGVVYEARPNVTYDVFALCMKSGNVCLLKGGADARHSNEAAVGLIRQTLAALAMPQDAVLLMPPTHEATAAMLGATGYVDLCIPRGGRRLIDFVRTQSRVPVIETGAGVVHTYFDEYGDAGMGAVIIDNAKTRRPSVCNALDTLLVHASRLGDLPRLCERLTRHSVRIFADERAYRALCGHYPAALLAHAPAGAWATEYMDYAMGVCTVDTIAEAIAHIDAYGSGHSESIVTADPVRAAQFQREVDAACVYVNAPTSFTDGAQFGLGAEIGISTQKLGARGPMGLEEITTYKWLVEGRGQTRA